MYIADLDYIVLCSIVFAHFLCHYDLCEKEEGRAENCFPFSLDTPIKAT